MGKFIGMLLVLAIGLGAGYYVGSNRMVNLKRDFDKIKAEMAEKASRLEREVTNLRHRDHLIVAKDKLNNARQALSERNYGEAQKSIQTAQEELLEAQKLANAADKEKYSALSSGLNEISSDLAHPTNPQLREKLQRVAKDLDRLAEK